MCKHSTPVWRTRAAGYKGAPRTCASIVSGIGGSNRVKASEMSVGWVWYNHQYMFPSIAVFVVHTVTFPFHPPSPGATALPSPAARFRKLPVLVPLVVFPETPPAISLPSLLIVFDQVPVGGRQEAQNAHCRRISGPRSKIIIRYGSATRAPIWRMKSVTTAKVCSIAYFIPCLRETRGMAFVVGVSSREP